MAALRLFCWNVNGIRSVHRKGLLPWLDATAPDVLCLQEIRAEPEQMDPAVASPLGYHAVWNPSRARKGYSGTGLLTRTEPLAVELGLGEEEFDIEGRTIVADYGDWVLLSAYFPNGRDDLSRVPYKLRFYELFLERCEEFRSQGKRVVFCGDLNTSHREIDLARPKANVKNTGFLPEEREWIDRMVEAGYVDTFRHLNPDTEDAYTWWTMRGGARARNVGWRLDYFFVDSASTDRIVDARIHADVPGSDHCPVELVFDPRPHTPRPRRHR
ncbi:MAG TPA: exodeoxyribonuclease III [Candidatus Krumholzibacteria bacterium]|nr:exodeoxyribonuclease III [Candidatus Krumholzibacteria bacterium]